MGSDPPSLFDNSSSSPTAALPSSPDSEVPSSASSDGASSSSSSNTSHEQQASGTGKDYPLSASFREPSIDGSVAGSRSDASADGADDDVNFADASLRPTRIEDVSDDDKQAALALKKEANGHFVASRYRQALDLYIASVNRNPFDPIVWSNRAAVRLKLEEHGLAISDATRALELDPKLVKAYYRRALANLAILKPKAALVDFKQVVAFEPANDTAKAQLEATQRLLRRLQFEKAIGGRDEVQTTHKVRDQISSGAAEIAQSYDGPRPKWQAEHKAFVPTEAFVKALLDWFKDGKLVDKRVAWEIVLGAFDRLNSEPSLVDVDIPQGTKLDVIGDTHGQFFDFVHLLNLTGWPAPDHALVFNGDFVDRGSWSTEVVLVLFALKWCYPDRVFLNRGNHETADMNKVYGFEGETKKKYSELTYKLFEEVFTALPLATLVSCALPPRAVLRHDQALHLPVNPTLHVGRKRYFVTHGGLFSNDGVTLDDVRKLDRQRQRQPGHEGLMCELLWCDPQDTPGRGPSKRGVGLGFGPDVTQRWTEANEVTAVIRSHEVRQDGYSVEHGGRCITVFSAPNYVDQVGNKAAFVTIDDAGEMVFSTFREQPHPNIRPMAYSAGFGGMI